MPVNEKMLRLQSCLKVKALEMVKDLGYSSNAYERAKEKLEKKYGGERRIQIEHLTTLRGWPRLRPNNLEDLEEFLTILDRILVALRNSTSSGDLNGHSLNLTAKEKLTEKDVRDYKFWLIERHEEDNLENLVEWMEMRVQIMDEAREETGEFAKRRNEKREKRNLRGFNTSKSKCIVDTCQYDHPSWVCTAFKKLNVTQRKELIARNRRCFRCLAAGHRAKECRKTRECGEDGCTSKMHSGNLHEPGQRTGEAVIP